MDFEQILKAWIQPSQPQKTYRLSSPSPTALGLVLPDDVIQAHVHLQSTFKKIKLGMNFGSWKKYFHEEHKRRGTLSIVAFR